MNRADLEKWWLRIGAGLAAVEPMLERLDGLIVANASREELLAAMQPLAARFALLLEAAHQAGELLPTRAPKPVPTDAESFARCALVNAIKRIESTKDLGVVTIETRELVRHVKAGHLDGALAKRALVNAATVAGLALDDVERVIASQTRAA